MNNAYLSLEQEFTLKLLSIQVQQNTDVTQLQDELINLLEKVLIKHHHLQDIYSFSQEQKENTVLYSTTTETFISELEAEASIFCYCIDSIKSNFNTGELQILIIEANEISMMQRNYYDLVISPNYAEIAKSLNTYPL